MLGIFMSGEIWLRLLFNDDKMKFKGSRVNKLFTPTSLIKDLTESDSQRDLFGIDN